ncbi:MAG: hypothetical protein U0797_09395 [Gemmataceae bacterium]
MRRLFLAGLIVAAGCQGVVGPAQRRCLPGGPIDDPRLTADEQNDRVRERVALPEGTNAYGPRTFAENPALKGAPQGSN